MKIPFLSRASMAVAGFFDASTTVSRERTALVASTSDHDRVLTARSRLGAMGQARALFENDGLTGGTIEAFARYSFPLFPRYNTGDKDNDRILDEYFKNTWAPQADANALMSWARLQESWCILRRVDGDVGIRITRDTSGFMRLRTIEGHRIGSEDKLGNLAYSDGVKLSKDGTALAYRIQPVDRTKPYNGLVAFGQSEDVPAAQFILYRWGVRPTAYRGFTALGRAVQHLHDRKDIVRFTKTLVKTASSVAMVLYKKGGADSSGFDDDNTGQQVDATGVVLAKLQAGEIPVLDPSEAEKLEQFQDTRPSPNTVAFLDYLARDIAVGNGIPVEFVWNSGSVGGTAQRTVNEQAAWAFSKEQDDFIQTIGNRVAALVAIDAVQNGRVKLKTAVDLPTLLRAPNWQRPPEVSIDRGQDREDRENIATGNATLDDFAARRGGDWQGVRNQLEIEAEDKLERAKRLSDKFSIPLPTALDLMGRMTANGLSISANAGDISGQTQETPKK